MGAELAGRVALVTGSSRGIGKGIALALGALGATVYVTGRSVREGRAAWPGTVGATAREIDRLGGTGVAVPCDHGDDAAVARLFEQVRAEQGRLDVLVNNVYAVPGLETPNGIPFWELPVEVWDSIHRVGLRSHYVASRFAAPLMLAQRSGLIVNVSSMGGAHYLFNTPYGVGKAAVERLAADLAHELRPFGIAALAIRPAAVHTERTLANPPSGDTSLMPAERQSTAFVGQAVAALAADSRIMAKSGMVLTVADIAREYGFMDTGPHGGAVPRVP